MVCKPPSPPAPFSITTYQDGAGLHVNGWHWDACTKHHNNTKIKKNKYKINKINK
jgi:hypothetical protein